MHPSYLKYVFKKPLAYWSRLTEYATIPKNGSSKRLISLSTDHLVCQMMPWARSIQPKFPEISVQNSMDRFGPTGKVSKKLVHLLRWSSFPGRTGWNFGWMDRAPCLSHNYVLFFSQATTCRLMLYALHTFPHKRSYRLQNDILA